MLQSTTVKFFALKSKILDRNLYRRFCIKFFFRGTKSGRGWFYQRLKIASVIIRLLMLALIFWNFSSKKLITKWARPRAFEVEVERVQVFLGPSWVPGLTVEPRKAQAFNNFPRTCFKPELFTNKAGTSKLEPPLIFYENKACWATSQGLIYSKPKIRPGPASPSPCSFHL